MRPAEFTLSGTSRRKICLPPCGIYLLEEPNGGCIIYSLTGPAGFWDITESYTAARRELYESMNWDPAKQFNSDWPPAEEE